MVDETVLQRRSSPTSALPVHRRASATATIGTSARSSNGGNSSRTALPSPRSFTAQLDNGSRSWTAAVGTSSTGSETLAAKLPRPQTAFANPSSLPPSLVGQDRFRYPTRSHTTGHQDENLTRSPSNLQSIQRANTATPALLNSGITHSSGESISTIDPLSQANMYAESTISSSRKAKSFLSRILHSKRKDRLLRVETSSDDGASDAGLPGSSKETRATGTDAEVFAQPINGYAYVPRYPDPPKYIKVRSHYRKQKDFDRVFVAQELSVPQFRRESVSNADGVDGASAAAPATSASDPKGLRSSSAKGQSSTPSHGRAIWTLEFSRSGRFLAAAGQDYYVRVWSVISSPADRQAHEMEEETRGDQLPIRLTAPVFKAQPVQTYEGHTGSVVDLSWSKNDFLLSTSMDKTVRLWHITRAECLCVFKHSDFVTSIKFHPKDDRFFLAGSLDMKLRLWSIPDKSVAYEAAAPDMITAVAFTPDGKHAIAGLLNGLCIIYDTDGLKVLSRIDVGGGDYKPLLHAGHGSHRKRWQSTKGSKITGIDSIVLPPENPCSATGQLKLLITSNDSRIRLYNFKDRTLEAKLRGNENSTSQIRASFSPDGRYIICGSESRKAYIWPLYAMAGLYDIRHVHSHNGWTSHAGSFKEKDLEFKSFEVFEAQSAAVTNAVMAPVRTKQILGASGDLLYDLCNPPPVTLGSGDSSAKKGSPTPELFHRLRETNTNKSLINQPVSRSPTLPSSGENPLKPSHGDDDVPEYMAPASHPDGNILVTADTNGSIKVFRQDCGYWKRPALSAAAAAIVGTASPASGNAVTGVSGTFDMTLAAQNASHTPLRRLSLLRYSSRSTRGVSVSAGHASNVSAMVTSGPVSRDSRQIALSQSRSTPNLPDDVNADMTVRGPIEKLKSEGSTSRRSTINSASPSERILHWRDTIPHDPNSGVDSVDQTRDFDAEAKLSASGRVADRGTRSPSPVPSCGSNDVWNHYRSSNGRRLAPRDRDRKVYKHHPYYDSREASNSQIDEKLPLEFRTALISPSESGLGDDSLRASTESMRREGIEFRDEADNDLRSCPSSAGFDKDVYLSLPGSPMHGRLQADMNSRSGFLTNAGVHPLSPPSTKGDKDTVRDSTSINRELSRTENETEAHDTSSQLIQADKGPESQSRMGAGLAAGALYWTRLAAQALTSRRSKPSLDLPKVTVSGTDGTNTLNNSAEHSPAAPFHRRNKSAQDLQNPDFRRSSTPQSQSTVDKTQSSTETSSRVTMDLASPTSPVVIRRPQFPEKEPEDHEQCSCSRVSRKSSFEYSDSVRSDIYDEDEEEEEEEELRCAGCGHHDFRALGKPRRLICTKCGTAMP
ncbi:hypothetical protein KEM54_000807 [Ascosphaera aggregata]|nr:hypothetical protein KEM54_000807 [Ascosphaera aggregata]